MLKNMLSIYLCYLLVRLWINFTSLSDICCDLVSFTFFPTPLTRFGFVSYFYSEFERYFLFWTRGRSSADLSLRLHQ